jgi:signal peptidase I
MAPAVSAGDYIATEGVTFLVRSPRRGDIVVFKSRQTDFTPAGIFYEKRIVAIPGDHLLISNGDLFIDDTLVTLSNNVGRIVYDPPPGAFALETNVTVPDGSYFLLGDDSPHSLDSRFFGSIRRSEIVGRVTFCYWPPWKIGMVK